MSRKADQYGNVHFISLYGAILSRLAYFNDNFFLEYYTQIFGPIITPSMLRSIDSASFDDVTNDEKMFNLVAKKGGSTADRMRAMSRRPSPPTPPPPIKPFNDYTRTELIDNKRVTHLAFNDLKIAENVNIVTKEIKGSVCTVPGQNSCNENILRGVPTQHSGLIKYISIGWSNYGEVFVVADKRMPKTLFLIFRGTYSAKTASLYSKPTSIVPLNVGCGKEEKFLYGIFKTNVELIHTTIEAMSYLATDFLGATEPNSVKVFTTGHSLGGALSTNFAYLWIGIKQMSPYNSAPYNVLSNKIICISLGAPRCMGTEVANKFCDFVKNKKIIYLRVTTRGDPVPGMPVKSGYQHPCSTNETMRKVVSEDCNANLVMRPLPNVQYEKPLDCQNYKTRDYIPNGLSHTIYLNILYTHALDFAKFMKGMGVSTEVGRTNAKETVCRVIIGTDKFVDTSTGRKDIKAGFFDVSKARGTRQTGGASISAGPGGIIQEDIGMNRDSFKKLVDQITATKPLVDRCPMNSTPDNMFDPFTPGITVPRLSCANASVPIGGGRKKRLGRTMKHAKNTRKKRGRTSTSKSTNKTRKGRGGYNAPQQGSRAEANAQKYMEYKRKCFKQTNMSMIKNTFKTQKNKSNLYKPNVIQTDKCKRMLNELNAAYEEDPVKPKRIIKYHDDSSSSI